jgi:hypothetical protein
MQAAASAMQVFNIAGKLVAHSPTQKIPILLLSRDVFALPPSRTKA